MSKYSVVIPMYNSAGTIRDSLVSVVEQTRYDLIDEIVIVDDGSRDGSAEVVRQFIKDYGCEKITLIVKKNGGAASARNAGIKAARKDWIALLDADDTWHSEKIEKQDVVVSSNEGILALGTNRDGEVINFGKCIDSQIYKLSPFQYCIKNWPCTPSLIFNRQIFVDQQYFDESLTHAEEGIFYLDIAARAGLYYLTAPLVLCGNGKAAYGESGLSGDIKRMHMGILAVMKKAYLKGYLSRMQYVAVCIYEHIKYVRRKIIVFFRKRG